ncbi:hypothetical protein O181_032207 [Austropuccinia psidii MF-1]|uniref:Uncharacterized protein n=1 Tax=Austropuccinia psidii MF-1 TaxID=1389203 RepID=A0A9Q3H621_9BASI|nr:hypothetical protein [Austropuccinia psidii MF-1]
MQYALHCRSLIILVVYERTSAFGPIMSWQEVIKSNSHDAPACANWWHNFPTHLSDLGTVNVTSSLEPRPRFSTQASLKSNTKRCANSNLRGTVRLKDSDEKKLLFSKLPIYLLVNSHTGSTRFLPSESILEISMSNKAPFTQLVLQSSEHNIKPQTPTAQKAANIP